MRKMTILLITSMLIVVGIFSGCTNQQKSTEVQNSPPTASATAYPYTGTAPLTVSFTGSGTDTDGSIASYQWSFGDGYTSTEQSPSHTYTTQGTYTATLTVTDNQGAIGTDSKTITVTLQVVFPTNVIYRTKVQLPVISDGSAIAWDGTYYYVLDITKGGVYQFNSDYSYTGNWFGYHSFTDEPRGITYHDGYLYIVSERFWWQYREIYKLTTSGVLQSTKGISSLVYNAGSIDSDSNYLYVCEKNAPYGIFYFTISDMSYLGYISNIHLPYGFAVNPSSNWFFIISPGGDTDRLYLCTMDGSSKWNIPFSTIGDMKIINSNTLIQIQGQYLYFYDITY